MFELEISVFDFIHKNVSSLNLKTCMINCPGDNLAQVLMIQDLDNSISTYSLWYFAL